MSTADIFVAHDWVDRAFKPIKNFGHKSMTWEWKLSLTFIRLESIKKSVFTAIKMKNYQMYRKGVWILMKMEISLNDKTEWDKIQLIAVCATDDDDGGTECVVQIREEEEAITN